MPRLSYAEAAPGGTLGVSRAPSVNDARYADYIAFADARAGLYAIPDGAGGKRQATAAEFWATPGNVSFDSTTYGVQDIILSAQTTVSAAVTAVLAAAEATLVFEFYGRSTTDRMVRPNTGGDLFLLQGTGANVRMFASSTALDCTRRRGNWQTRSRGVVAWSSAGRAISLNGGSAVEDAVQPGARTSPNFIAGRYVFIGVIASRKSAAWMRGVSFPEPTAIIHGDSLAQGDAIYTGLWSNALSLLLPGAPPMENMGIGGETAAQIETRFLAEAPELAARRMVWGGHNSYDPEDWKARVANMVANTRGGLANFALFPVMPSFTDDTGRDGGLRLSWIPRVRIGGDVWDIEPAEIDSRRFRVRVLEGEAERRVFEAEGLSVLYGTADVDADFPAALGLMRRLQWRNMGSASGGAWKRERRWSSENHCAAHCMP